jgi:hypothetical protein
MRQSVERRATGRPGLDSWQGKIFLFSVESIPALSPTQTPIQWVRGAFHES